MSDTVISDPMYKALSVVALDPAIRSWLVVNDRQTLIQVESARYDYVNRLIGEEGREGRVPVELFDEARGIGISLAGLSQ